MGLNGYNSIIRNHRRTLGVSNTVLIVSVKSHLIGILLPSFLLPQTAASQIALSVKYKSYSIHQSTAKRPAWK